MNSEDASQISSQPTPFVFPLTELGKPAGQWTLTLHPTHLALADAPGAQPYVLLRDAMMKTAVLMISMKTFAITEPRKVTFKLSAEATDALANWIGNGFLAAHFLKQRYAFVLPIAVIWILGAVPLLKQPDGAPAVPFDLFGFSLGTILVVMWAFAKWRPHPALFLVDSLWFLALAASLVMDVVNGRSKGWLVLVVLLLWMSITGVKYFLRFRGTRIVPRQNV